MPSRSAASSNSAVGGLCEVRSALSPKLSVPLDTWGEIFLQYSHYWYGDKVHLRAGQVPLETEPDTDVFKLQAQVVW